MTPERRQQLLNATAVGRWCGDGSQPAKQPAIVTFSEPEAKPEPERDLVYFGSEVLTREEAAARMIHFGCPSEEIVETLSSLVHFGGPGSGNYGHAGCPGVQGGSCDSGGAGGKEAGDGSKGESKSLLRKVAEGAGKVAKGVGKAALVGAVGAIETIGHVVTGGATVGSNLLIHDNPYPLTSAAAEGVYGSDTERALESAKTTDKPTASEKSKATKAEPKAAKEPKSSKGKEPKEPKPEDLWYPDKEAEEDKSLTSSFHPNNRVDTDSFTKSPAANSTADVKSFLNNRSQYGEHDIKAIADGLNKLSVTELRGVRKDVGYPGREQSKEKMVEGMKKWLTKAMGDLSTDFWQKDVAPVGGKERKVREPKEPKEKKAKAS